MTRTLLAALALACVAAPAYAVEAAAVAATPSVVLPYGDLIVAFANSATALLLPVLVGVITTAIYQVAPWARLFLTQARVESMVKSVTDYGLNAIDGAAKGQQLTIPIGSAVIAKAVQRGIDAAPAAVVKAAGGPQGLAERVFRTLNLEPGANAANTLAPAQAAIPPK